MTDRERSADLKDIVDCCRMALRATARIRNRSDNEEEKRTSLNAHAMLKSIHSVFSRMLDTVEKRIEEKEKDDANHQAPDAASEDTAT